MLHFVKAETNGNDFIIIENAKPETVNITKLAHRRYGIGADQIIFANHSEDGRINVRFFNSDGTFAQICGNGLCALTKYYNKKCTYIVGQSEYECTIDEKGVSHVPFPIPTIIKTTELCKIVDTGNKHIVFLEPNDQIHKYIQDYNVHYIQKIDDTTIKVETYERGAGRTLACGSGAIAVAFAYGNTTGLANHIKHDGGTSQVVVKNNSAVLIAKSNITFYGDSEVFDN